MNFEWTLCQVAEEVLLVVVFMCVCLATYVHLCLCVCAFVCISVSVCASFTIYQMPIPKNTYFHNIYCTWRDHRVCLYLFIKVFSGISLKFMVIEEKQFC